MEKHILWPENKWVQTKITTPRKFYFVSSTEHISKLHEHYASTTEDDERCNSGQRKEMSST